MKRITFILKCFLQFTCTNLDDCQNEGGNFLNLLQKEEGSLREGGGDYECIKQHFSDIWDSINK